jgi:DNA ligase (NAD+)
MTELDPKIRINTLTEELNMHNHNYYVLDNPTISDYAFDQLLKELEKLENSYPNLKRPDSPTSRVGGTPIKRFEQSNHQFPMLSLGNTYSEEELVEFDDRIKKNLEEPFEYVGELKFDGVAISLTYQNGLLVKAVTRGNGVTGDIVTENIKTIRSIPLKLTGNNYPENFEIRGEVFIHRSDFEKLNQDRINNGDEPYANPRNFASGTLKLLDSREVSRRKLDCYLYYINSETLPFATHTESLQAAKSWGFKISEHLTPPTDLKGILEYINHWETERDQLPFDIDGIVIKIDNLEQRAFLGNTAKNPRWAISYKFKAKSASTTILGVTYQVGRTGAITPVAELVPVLLAGTVVKRASLYNEAEIKRLDLHENDTVFVEKGGEIIPKITGVDLTSRKNSAQPFSFIASCPDCNSILIKNEGEAIHYCPNETGCPPQLLGKLEHFVSRKAMNIDAIGKETLQQLIEAQLVKNVADLYDLKEEQLSVLDRMGKKSIDNILQGIQASKQVPYERVLFALGIRLVGETVSKTLVKNYPTLEALQLATKEELTSIHEIGAKIAENIVRWFSSLENLNIIERLKKHELNFAGTLGVERKGDQLEGKNLVVSGVFKHYERDALKALIESYGGKVQSSVNSKTDFLVAGDGMGPSKLAKANELKIKIISEEEFEKMIP